MPGLIPHLAAGLILAAVVHYIHFKLEFSLSAFIGNLLPDVIKFGFTAIKQATLSIFSVNQDGFYQSLASITSNTAVWVGAGIFVAVLALFLYQFHYIKKKTMKEYDELYVFLLVGIVIHLMMDTLIAESGPWW